MSAPLRLPRALVLALAATLVGAASHLLSGGTLDLTGASCAVPVLVALAWPLTGRERGWLPILGVQLVGQQLAHILFGLGAGPATHDPALPIDAWFYGHVAAAVVVATWLRFGERRTWAAARRAASAVSAFWRALLRLFGHDVTCPDVAAPAVDGTPVRPSHPLRHSLVRRGPPLFV
jgi:hypothetical protein